MHLNNQLCSVIKSEVTITQLLYAYTVFQTNKSVRNFSAINSLENVGEEGLLYSMDWTLVD